MLKKVNEIFLKTVSKPIIKMSLLRIPNPLSRRFIGCKYFSSALSTESEYTATPQYPPILDMSFDARQERKHQTEYDEIKAVKTVEEKQIKLNMPKFYGFKSNMLEETRIPYDNLKLAQFVTRTHLINNLPNYYDRINVENLPNLKTEIEEAVLLEIEGYRRIHDLKKEELGKDELENIFSVSLTKQINRILINNLSRLCPHLVDARIGIDSRIESSWFAGGMKPPEIVKKRRAGRDWLKDRVNDPINRLMYYIGSPNVTLTSDQPLRPIISAAEAENPDLQVPKFEQDPRTVGIVCKHMHIANIPGFWPGERNQFGLLSYHKRGHLLTRNYNDEEDAKEAVHRQGILASFGWLNAQANFLGFTTFNDITYPLVTQTIITNGQIWSFYAYQLNTIVNHSKYVDENPKRNICWATPELKLYEDVQDGKLIGFNDEILKILAKFYANVPEARLGINLTPYLSQEEKVSADYQDEDKREWLEREYKFLVSNRPRFKEFYEIYAWEKIYKVDNETRFMEKRRRPFELKINPAERRLDDRKPNYIPRALRPDLPRHKGRDAKEYFP